MTEFTQIDDGLRAFIEAQRMFFVGTAAADGRIGVSPKGMDSLRVLEPNRIVWLNLTGSENETAAHLIESPRMTIMWCSVAGRPQILRAYGTARSIHPRDAEWAALSALFPAIPGARQILDFRINLALTSCGYGVPLFDFVGPRDNLARWAEHKGAEGLATHWAERNSHSLDGRPTGILEDVK